MSVTRKDVATPAPTNKPLCCIVNPAQCANDGIDSHEEYERCPNKLDACIDHIDGYTTTRSFRDYWCERCIIEEQIATERAHDLAKDRRGV